MRCKRSQALGGTQEHRRMAVVPASMHPAVDGAGGNDLIEGGGGSDTLNGGAGTDTVSYASSTAAVQINLQTGIHTGGDAQGDILTSFEKVIGSAYDDTIVAASTGTIMEGGAGADELIGGLAAIP